MENLEVVSENNGLPIFPKWARHRIIAAQDSADPTKKTEGVVAHDWKSVWLDIAYKDAGTKTATLKILFWEPFATITVVDGAYVYTGGWVEQDFISDITIDAGDNGHKCVHLETYGRAFFVKATAFGAGAEAHVFVAGDMLNRYV